MAGRILLLRHGETNWKFRGRLQGLAPVALNDHGREQSKMLADYLQRQYQALEGVYTSDLRRAKETAVIVHGAFDEEPDLVVEETLQEIDWGVWQGMQLGYIIENYPEFDFNENGRDVMDVAPKHGESLNEVKHRTLPYWQRFREMVGSEDSDHPYVMVTHSQPISAIMADVTDKSYFELVKNYNHEPIETAEVVVDDDGEIVSFEDPEPPWNTV